ncbi:MAG: hypothetical protein WCJ14_02385 [Verrucomicrobiota bacterium]
MRTPKPMAFIGTACSLILILSLIAAQEIQAAGSGGGGGTREAHGEYKSPFAGLRALVVVPGNSDSDGGVTYGALHQLGMDVVRGEPATLVDAKALGQYNLVATNTLRAFTPAQVAGLKAYLAGGGALYGTWGGPMNCPELLRLCGASAARSVYIRELTLLDSPLTEGIGECHLPFPSFMGDAVLGQKGREMVAFDFADGLRAAKDAEGRCLGILKEHGKGRSAVLGFTPEDYKSITQDTKISDRVFDNLLGWLIPKGATPRSWSNVIEVNLPRRAEIISVSVNGAPVDQPAARLVGSLKTLTLPATAIGAGQTATVRVTYQPLAKARNVETWVHNPSSEFLRAFETPAQAADFLASLHATVVQPLLRSTGGGISYRGGIPGDTCGNPKLTNYPGDYLAEYIDECHKRGIKVIGGVYLDWQKCDWKTSLYQDAPVRIEKSGEPARKNLLCPANPKLLERNLDVVRNLVGNYKMDGLMLDDSYECRRHPCYCDDCKGQFRAYCEQKGAAYKDPALASDTDAEFTALWKGYWNEGFHSFLGKVRETCRARGIPVGGWCGGEAGLDRDFDFLGGMLYGTPPSSARGPLERLGSCGFVTLLWGMDREPANMEEEVVEAIRAGSTDVGFWLHFNRMEGSKDPWGLGTEIMKPLRPYGFTLMPGSLDAVARAFGRVEEEWINYYRNHILAGDSRFVVVSAHLEKDSLTLVIKNTGQRSERRIIGPVDLSAIQ